MSWVPEIRSGNMFLLAAMFLVGALVGSVATSEMSAEVAPQVAPPAFLIGVTGVAEPGALTAYSEAAGPLAARAGIQGMAQSPEVHVLEGEWPFEGRTVLLERFTSLQALLDFWYSNEYQEAKKLREGLVDIEFLIAVEGGNP